MPRRLALLSIALAATAAGVVATDTVRASAGTGVISEIASAQTQTPPQAPVTPLAVAQRLETPVAPVAEPVVVSEPPITQVVNRSTCHGNATGAVMTIVIPDISYSCPVYSGGQATMDSGEVTFVTDRGTSPLLAEYPGDTGTLWIAAHRSSHGGAFAAVPALADGAVITVSDGTVTASYRVVARSYVRVRDGLVVDSTGQATHAATLAAIVRADLGGGRAPRLLLQTCDGENFRWMIYADLIS